MKIYLDKWRTLVSERSAQAIAGLKIRYTFVIAGLLVLLAVAFMGEPFTNGALNQIFIIARLLLSIALIASVIFFLTALHRTAQDLVERRFDGKPFASTDLVFASAFSRIQKYSPPD